MLIKIREKSGGWVAKIILGVLVVAFAVFFGFGDFSRLGGGRQQTAVAVVGDTEISVTRLEREYRIQLRTVTSRLGIDAQEARRLGLAESVLQQMIGEALFDQAAADRGIVVGDTLVRDNIRNRPAFRTNGEFDPAAYRLALSNRGISEAGYWVQNRRGIARVFLSDSMVGGAAAPERMAEAVFRHRGERRVAEILVIANDSTAEVGAPDEATLAAFHAENPDRFMAPEYRAITFVSLTPEDLLAEVFVAEDEIADEYAYRGDEYFTPEQRDVEQLIYSNRAAALKAWRQLVEGADIAALASDSGALNADSVVLGLMRHGDMLEGIGDAVFALGKGEVSAPLESPFGWHVFRINAIVPESQASLAEVRDEIRRDLALQQAGEVVIDLGNALQDELAAGDTLSQAAARLDLPVAHVEAVDARGLDRDGGEVAGLPADRAGFLRAAFEAELEFETPLIDSPRGDALMLVVERVTPPAARPLESVREAAIAAWKGLEIVRAAAARGETLAEAARLGQELSALAAQRGLSVRTTEPVGRQAGNADPDLSASLIARLFDAEMGEIVTAPRPAGNGHVVARLKEVLAPERGDGDTFAQIREGLGRSIGQDLMAQYQAHLADDLGVEVNQGTLDTLF